MKEPKQKTEDQSTEEQPNKVKAYLKKLGWAGIIFFTVKGCISTAIIIFGVKSCT